MSHLLGCTKFNYKNYSWPVVGSRWSSRILFPVILVGVIIGVTLKFIRIIKSFMTLLSFVSSVYNSANFLWHVFKIQQIKRVACHFCELSTSFFYWYLFCFCTFFTLSCLASPCALAILQLFFLRALRRESFKTLN